MSEETFEYKGEKLVDELWFSSGQFLGERPAILITESKLTGERRCRIGVVLGLNFDEDRKNIIEHGDRMTVPHLERILAALRGDA